MQYISYNFLYFSAASVLLYYITPKKFRKYILLLANIVFYLFSGLPNAAYLLGFTGITYGAALLCDKLDSVNKKAARGFFVLYTVISAGSLVFVKFANYALNGFSMLTGTSSITLNIIYPLGIAFFTLQGISYVADVYRGKYSADRNFINVAVFMTFFPLIVQGPISRYNRLSKQLNDGHRFDGKKFCFGLQLLLWGLFKKLVIANRAAAFADEVFNNYSQYSGMVIVTGAVIYSIQLYADFSGCVDICRGVSELFGITLDNNFNFPYSAVSIKDFWARWHISLSSWLKDYIYIPLGGNRKGKIRKYLNIIIVFMVSGIWHGVGLHYIVWGLYHGFLQAAGDILRPARAFLTDKLHVEKKRFSYKFGRQIMTFGMVAYGWLLFRANGLRSALAMTRSVFYKFFCIDRWNAVFDTEDFRVFLCFMIVFAVVSFFQKRYSLREKLARQNLWFRFAVCLSALFTVIIFGVYGSGYNASDFLYMQF